MKILILDDDLSRIKAFQNNLAGHDLVCVHRQIDAIGALATDKFDMVFLDHDLPDTNVATGLNVAFFIKLCPEQFKDLKICIHSRNYYGLSAMKMVLPQAAVWPGIWDFPEELNKLVHSSVS